MFVRVGPHLRVEAEISVPSYLFVSLCSMVHGIGVAYQCLFGDSHHNRRAKKYTRAFSIPCTSRNRLRTATLRVRGSQHVVHVLVQLSCASAGGCSFCAYVAQILTGREHPAMLPPITMALFRSGEIAFSIYRSSLTVVLVCRAELMVSPSKGRGRSRLFFGLNLICEIGCRIRSSLGKLLIGSLRRFLSVEVLVT
jgi:hypothetical protein